MISGRQNAYRHALSDAANLVDTASNKNCRATAMSLRQIAASDVNSANLMADAAPGGCGFFLENILYIASSALINCTSDSAEAAGEGNKA